MSDAPLTCLDLWCKAGSSTERAGEEGLAHFLEHMVFKGSICLAEGEFDQKIEALGGSSNAATGFDDVHFQVLVPPKVLEPALELLLTLVLDPALRSDSFLTEREVVLEEIAQYQDQPDEQVFQKLLESCLATHPYGRPILGFESSLKASNPDQMRSFHKRLYQGRNCCLAIAGAIPNDIEILLKNSRISSLENQASDSLQTTKPKEINFQRIRKDINVPRLESARLLMAWLIPSAKEQLVVMGADIATSLLSEGRRSRLVQKLREELQIVESIDMDVTVLEQGSLILLEAYCLEENLEIVELEIRQVLAESICSMPQEQELNRARQLVRNGLFFSLEASSQVAGLAGSQTLWNRKQPLLYPLKHIDYWTGKRLRDDLFPLLNPNKSCVLIARPQEGNQ